MRPAIYFTTAPRSCDCSVANDDDGLDLEHRYAGIHYDRCPARCWAVTTADRFGRVGTVAPPTRRVQCEGVHDHDGDHRAVSNLGGHSVWWTDEETRHFEGGSRS